MNKLCPECQGKGTAFYYVELSRNEWQVTMRQYEDVCHTCHGSGEIVMTNADRIRAMTDEELAWELMMWRCEAVARHHGVESEYPDTQKTILDWIQQPCEGADHTCET